MQAKTISALTQVCAVYRHQLSDALLRRELIQRRLVERELRQNASDVREQLPVMNVDGADLRERRDSLGLHEMAVVLRLNGQIPQSRRHLDQNCGLLLLGLC